MDKNTILTEVEKQPFVSVIVAIYNVSERLPECLNSIVNQTLDNIEIICVDDCSTDNSPEIICDFMKKDDRIKVIFNPENMGTLRTRKRGVEASKGKYIMFVDGDDKLFQDACQVAFREIEKYQTDILHFGVEIVNCGAVSMEEINGNKRFTAPCLEMIHDKNLIFSRWRDRKFGFNLWNKIYNGNICRKAFEMIEDIYCNMAEDLYIFFVIAYYSKSCMGIENKLYCYNYGIGIVGNEFVSLDKFDFHLSQKVAWDAIERFISILPDKDELQEIADGIHHHFVRFCVNKWKDNLVNEAVSSGFLHMIHTWGTKPIICELMRQNWYKPEVIAEKLLCVDFPKHRNPVPDKRTTIAVYFHSSQSEDVRKNVTALCNLWAEMCNVNGERLYKVLCITDGWNEQITDDIDCPLDNTVERKVLPVCDEKNKKYDARYRVWNSIVTEEKIDIVIYSAGLNPCLLWDLLTVKSHSISPAFIMHSYFFCAFPYSMWRRKCAELYYTYQLCDGVVTTSDVDEKYMKGIVSHTDHIPNPLTVSLSEVRQSEYADHILIWQAPFSPERRPQDVVKMMSFVREKIPDAKLYMIGKGTSSAFEEIEDLIENLKLEKNIILTNESEIIKEIYKKASVLIGTAEYEGFSKVYEKAFAAQIPIVAYELPWITYHRFGKGIITVEQKRIDLLAKEVCSLLKDKERIEKLGVEGRQYLQQTENSEIKKQWRIFFEKISVQDMENRDDEDMNLLLKYITMNTKKGKEFIVRNANREKARAEDAEKLLKQERAMMLEIVEEKKHQDEKIIQMENLLKQSQMELTEVKKEISNIKRSRFYKIGKALSFFKTK